MLRFEKPQWRCPVIPVCCSPEAAWEGCSTTVQGPGCPGLWSGGLEALPVSFSLVLMVHVTLTATYPGTERSRKPWVESPDLQSSAQAAQLFPFPGLVSTLTGDLRAV